MTHIVIPYAPRSQFLSFHNRQQRWAVIVAHRRAGKTVAAINELIRGALTCKLDQPRYAYVAPYYSQAKDVAWEYLKRFGLVVPGSVANESELRIDFPNGGRVRLYGADNYDRMRGIYLDGVVLDEYGDQHPAAWREAIRPALSDRGGWAVFIGTPKGQNHFAELWDAAQGNQDWYSAQLKASQTGILAESELYDARKHMTPEQYAAEYECSFYGSIQGSYYGREIELLENNDCITDMIGCEPGVAVNTAWDVGGTTAIWMFQCIGHEIRVVDYLEGHNVGVDWYVSKMRERPYVYGKHILPSDADDEKEIVGISWVDALAKLGIHDVHVLRKQQSIDNGINAARLLLQRCRFVKSKTLDGVSALRNYRREYDDKRKNFRDHPLHDWASHGSDCFRYLALGIDAVGQGAAWSKPINYRNRGII